MACPNCGAEVPEGANFCASCGTALAPGATPARGLAAQPASLRVFWSEFVSRWPGGTPDVVLSVALTLLGVLLGLIGMLITTTSGVEDAGKTRGATLSGFAFVLVILALAWSAAARGHARDSNREPWMGALAGAAALLAVVMAVVGLVKAYSDDQIASFDANAAWFPFAGVLAFAALAWLVLTRPLPWSLARLAALAVGVLAFVFGLVGLAVGLGTEFSDFLHGDAWGGLAATLALLAAAAHFGAEPRPASEEGGRAGGL